MSALKRRRSGVLLAGGLAALILALAWPRPEPEPPPPSGGPARSPPPAEPMAGAPGEAAPSAGPPLPSPPRTARLRPRRADRDLPPRSRRVDAAAADPGVSFDPPVGATPAASTQAILTLVVNGRPLGEVRADLEGGARVPAGELRAAGFPLAVSADDEALVDLSALAGVRAVDLDLAALVLAVDVDPAALAPQVIRVEAARPPPGTDYDHPATAWLNHALRVVDLDHAEAYGELGVSVGPARLRSDATWIPGDRAWRGLSSLTVDDRADRVRLVLGDAVVSPTALAGTGVVGGLQVGRAFALDPYLPLGPTLGAEALAAGPSTVEVWVNDRLVERTEVPAGPVDVQDIPLTPGAGETRVVIRDALGREQVTTWRGYVATGVLAAGLHDWSWSLGWERGSVGVESFDYRDPVVVGRHRYGASRRFTPGARLEGRLDGATVMADLVTDVEVGELELAGGASLGPDGEGWAASAAWGYSASALAFGAWSRLASPDWVALGSAPGEDRAVVDAGASLGVSAGARARFSLGGGASWTADGARTDRGGASVGVQVHRDLQLGASATWNRPADDEGEVAVLASLTVPVARRTLGSVRGEYAAAEESVAADLRRSLPVEGGYGYQLAAEAGDTVSALAAGDLRTASGQASGRVDVAAGQAFGSVGWSGALVAGGGRLFYSSPVTQSFAIVRAPGVPGATVRVNQAPAGRTDRRGDALVHGLLPYYGNVVSIDAGDLPLGTSLRSTDAAVAPGERSGAVVRFTPEASRWVRGTLGGAALPPGADLVVATPGGPLVSPVGKEGAFELPGLGTGVWLGEVAGCAVRLEVPESSDPFLDLGEVACVTAEAGP